MKEQQNVALIQKITPVRQSFRTPEERRDTARFGPISKQSWLISPTMTLESSSS